MERRLIVMRHASSPRGESDHGRPISDKGRREAEEIAERLVEVGWIPQRVLSSDATRTRQTWEAMAPAFDPAPPAEFIESLYLAGVDAIEDALATTSDDITDVLLLGHNPGWQSAVSYFSGRQERMMTANAALLHGTGDDWPDAAGAGQFELVQVLRPRSL